MKEQLIRQLVKNEKDSAALVKQHKDKITVMEEVSHPRTRHLLYFVSVLFHLIAIGVSVPSEMLVD